MLCTMEICSDKLKTKVKVRTAFMRESREKSLVRSSAWRVELMLVPRRRPDGLPIATESPAMASCSNTAPTAANLNTITKLIYHLRDVHSLVQTNV